MLDMDPNCAVCDRPAEVECNCEAKQLESVIRVAQKTMMSAVLSNIRNWVRDKARDCILSYYTKLLHHRQQTHAVHLQQLAQEAHYYNKNIHPVTLAHAEAELKHNIDEDWKASVQRYPEVLEYFYGLVEVSLPDEKDTCVTDPPFSFNEEQLPWRPINMRERDPLGAQKTRDWEQNPDVQLSEEDSELADGWQEVDDRGSFSGRSRQPEDVEYERGHVMPSRSHGFYSHQERY